MVHNSKPKGTPRATPAEFRDPFGMLVFADEMGDKLSELGRFGVVSTCFRGFESKDFTLVWALCGPDVKALDIKKLEAELDAENIAPDSQKLVLAHVQDELATLKKAGEAVETAAKDDPGIVQVLNLAAAAKEDWAAWLAKHRPEYERLLLLKDAVRSGKSNHKNYAGCWEATRPAFAKLVAASKFEWDTSLYLTAYMTELQATIDGYITSAAFAACAVSVDKTGEVLAAAALGNNGAGIVRMGWRTLAVAKAIDPKLKPKFADRSLEWGEDGMPRKWRESGYQMTNVGRGDITADITPQQGEIAKVAKNGDMLKISFKGATVDTCLEWKDTKKVQQVAANGDVLYEKVCKKRGQGDATSSDVEVATKFADGIKPGASVWVIKGFPVTVWKGKKFISVFGMPTSANARK